jgi:hypothetical protein
MDIKTMNSERFAEELFFLLMSSPVRDRVQTLGVKYGLSRKDLRDEIVLFGKGIGEQIYLSRRTGPMELRTG